jgi:RHS repeat-associated protein
MTHWRQFIIWILLVSFTSQSVLAFSPSYDANDRLTTDTHDANGNTLQGRVGVSPAESGVSPPSPSTQARTSGLITGTDAYDSYDRLRTRQAADGSLVQVRYNGDGHRVSQSVLRQNGGTSQLTTTQWLVDDLNPTGYAQVIEEHTATGTAALGLSAVFIYGHDLISQDRQTGTTWSLSYYGYDGHGCVRHLTDAAGTVTDTFDYDAWGQLLHSTGTTTNPYLYTGEQYDPALGLYHLRARMMNPLTGRFWNRDTYEGQNGDPASLHKYLYGNGDPVQHVDPSGHMSLGEAAATVQIQGILNTINIGYRIIGVIDKAKSFIEIVIGVRQIVMLLGGELTLTDWKKFVPSANLNLQDAALKFLQLAISAFASASPNWIAGYAADLAKGKRISSYLIYLPTFIPWPKESRISSGLKIGGLPVQLIAGANSKNKVGGLLGIGVGIGKSNQQLLRMDWHNFKDSHGGTDGLQTERGEIYVLKSPPYHMHVYGWGAPPTN